MGIPLRSCRFECCDNILRCQSRRPRFNQGPYYRHFHKQYPPCKMPLCANSCPFVLRRPCDLSPADMIDSDSLSPAPSLQPEDDPLLLPTKIQAMAAGIMNHNGKCVVLSYWRPNLDVVGRALGAANIPNVSIDGTMNKAGREPPLKAFRNKPLLTAILPMISIAGLGLDLTGANLACLLDPQWYPSMEEQA